MQADSEATLQEERREVLVSIREAMSGTGRDSDLAAAAGFLLRHLANTSSRRTATFQTQG